MKDPLDYALGRLMDALNRLREGAAEAQDELDRDGVIQRFEFCFELLWKTLKIFLLSKGIDVRSPKDSLKAAFAQGWITDEEAFLDMLADRNRTSHIYSREEAQNVFDRVRNQYVPLIDALARLLGDMRQSH